jgi:hypothetical protein
MVNIAHFRNSDFGAYGVVFRLGEEVKRSSSCRKGRIRSHAAAVVLLDRQTAPEPFRDTLNNSATQRVYEGTVQEAMPAMGVLLDTSHHLV